MIHMFKRNKVERIPLKEFMDRDWKEKREEKRKTELDYAIMNMSMAGVALHTVFRSKEAHAGAIGDVILHAFDPIIDLLQGCSYPVAFLMMTAGFLLIMTGQTSRGVGFIKWACIGYLGLQFAPALMKIVGQIGAQIASEVGNI